MYTQKLIIVNKIKKKQILTERGPQCSLVKQNNEIFSSLKQFRKI